MSSGDTCHTNTTIVTINFTCQTQSFTDLRWNIPVLLTQSDKRTRMNLYKQYHLKLVLNPSLQCNMSCHIWSCSHLALTCILGDSFISVQQYKYRCEQSQMHLKDALWSNHLNYIQRWFGKDMATLHLYCKHEHVMSYICLNTATGCLHTDDQSMVRK